MSSIDGRPVPTTIYKIDRAKVDDGKSIRVTVPENTTIIPEKPYLIEGFFGIAVQGVQTGAGETAEIILNIAQEEFETDKITVADSFPMGAPLYYDDATGLLTTTAGTRMVGRVSKPKDVNNVIWFILGPQV